MIRRRHLDDAQAFSDALAGRPPARGEVAELVQVAETICAAAALEPSATFRSSLREQLMTDATEVLVLRTPPRPSLVRTEQEARRPARRRLAGLGAAAVASIGVVGMVSSSAGAVPGDMLYSVKQGVESVQLSMQTTPTDRGTFQLDRADERLTELRTIVDRGATGDEERVASALEDFTEQAEAGSTSLFDSYSTSGSAADIDAVNDFAAGAALDLGELSSLVPPAAGGSFDTAAETVGALAAEAARLCGACAEADVSSLAGRVSSLASGQDAPVADAPSAQDSGDDPVADAPAPTTRAPAAQPGAAAVPAPAPTTAPTVAPSVRRSVTEPVVGALLGDEKQNGLVPGLLDGLLGSSKK